MDFKVGDRVRVAAKSPSTTRGMVGTVQWVFAYNPTLPDGFRYRVQLDDDNEGELVPYKQWELEPVEGGS